MVLIFSFSKPKIQHVSKDHFRIRLTSIKIKYTYALNILKNPIYKNEDFKDKFICECVV